MHLRASPSIAWCWAYCSGARQWQCLVHLQTRPDELRCLGAFGHMQALYDVFSTYSRLSAGPYRKTVNLPQTKFNMRANSKQREPELQKWWQKSQIYERLSQENKGEPFILHDGPPYANGDLHIGHALNKVASITRPRLNALQLTMCSITACRLHVGKIIGLSHHSWYAPGWQTMMLRQL